MNRILARENSGNPLNKWWGDDLDRAFDGFFRPMRSIEEAANENLIPAIDVVERDNDFVVRTDLPGVKKEDINITMENGVLTIAAEYTNEHEQKDGARLIRQERRYGRYARSLRLGTQINEKGVKANYKDGVLELILPKAEEVKPRKISVDVG